MCACKSVLRAPTVDRFVCCCRQKNSWGPKFGEGGFYRMERNRRQVDFTGAAFPIAAATTASLPSQ
jgi:hypothetical protein